jgi:hypothetical protein
MPNIENSMKPAERKDKSIRHDDQQDLKWPISSHYVKRRVHRNKRMPAGSGPLLLIVNHKHSRHIHWIGPIKESISIARFQRSRMSTPNTVYTAKKS